MNMNKYNKEN